MTRGPAALDRGTRDTEGIEEWSRPNSNLRVAVQAVVKVYKAKFNVRSLAAAPCVSSDAVLALITLLAVAVDRRKPLQDAASQTGTSPKGFVDVTRPQDAAIVLKVSQ